MKEIENRAARRGENECLRDIRGFLRTFCVWIFVYCRRINKKMEASYVSESCFLQCFMSFLMQLFTVFYIFGRKPFYAIRYLISSCWASPRIIISSHVKGPLLLILHIEFYVFVMRSSFKHLNTVWVCFFNPLESNNDDNNCFGMLKKKNNPDDVIGVVWVQAALWEM